MTKILLIDDEADILRVLSMSLKADGYDVVTALSGEEGLTVFEQESPDLVLTDIKMPGMDGIQVLKQIKVLSDESEVIIITGHGDIDSAIEALQYGASDFINKPVRDRALAISLKRALEKIDIKRRLKEYTHGLEDKVALNYNLGDDYRANKKGVKPVDMQVVNDYEINGKRNPHKSYGYLRVPEMAETIHHFLKH